MLPHIFRSPLAKGLIRRSSAKAVSLAALSLLALLLIVTTVVPAQADTGPRIAVLTLKGVINPVAVRYVDRALGNAQSDGTSLVILRLDTPGGMDSSMREIIQRIVNSKVPVVVYVSPAGARAASAGAFITMAGHVAAMAPNTAIGAAHPVGSRGEDIPGSMGDKVVNDAAAYIKSLASQRNRNTEWVEKAVRESVSVTEKEALKLNVVDLLANDLDALVDSIDGREVQLISGPATIKSKGVRVVYDDQSIIERFMYFISDPTIAYVLIALALLGLFLELATPGAVLPGVIGGVSLLLALFSLGMLPINFTGVLFIVLAFILFLAEVKVVSHGVLTMGGVISMAIGSLMLINSSQPYLTISRPVIAAVVLTIAGCFAFAIRAVLKTRHQKSNMGIEGLVGQIGIARSVLNPLGTVMLEGELWSAVADGESVSPGGRVKVLEVDGLTLKVVKIPWEGETNA